MINDSLKEIERLKEENSKLKIELNQINEKLAIQNGLINNAPFFAWAVNEKFEYIFISRSFRDFYEKLFGFKLSLGQDLFETIPTEYIPVWKRRFSKAMKAKKFVIHETVSFQGRTKHYQLHIYPIKANDKITEIQVFMNEVTQSVEAEIKKTDSLKKLKEILQHVQDIYYEADLNGKILDVSPAIKKISTYTQDEVIGTYIHEIYTNPDDRKLFLKEIQEKGQVKNYMIQAVDKNKRNKTVAVNASLIFDDFGQPLKIIGVLRDITDIEKINNDLRWLRRAIEHSPISIIITDTQGIIEYTNPFFTKTTGYSQEEALGKKPSIFKSDQQGADFYKKLWETITHGKIWEGEFLNKRKDGSFFWERATISPVRNKFGKITNYIAIKEDFTKQKESADEIKRLKAFNERIINTMREGIVVESYDGTILYTNPAFSKMTGYSNQEVVGQNWRKIIDPKFHDVALKANKRRRNNLSDSYEIKLQTKNGRSIPVLIGGTPIIEDGNFEGLVAVITDVRLLKAHENKIKKALKRAKISDTLKSSFLANMSHEIRTPMNAILGFADILRNERNIDEETREEYFKIIDAKGNELLQIISDIVDISKIESKVIDINRHEFELNDFLRRVHESFKKELAYNNKAIKTILTLPESTDYLKIVIDKYRLNQILTNLLNNSLKFTEEGEIEFGYEIVDSEFRFFVRDTGIGISKTDQKIIFDRFRQAGTNYTRTFGGTGLGLNICKNLVNILGGDIEVKSELNVGSIFYFTIPQKKRAN